MRSICAWCQKPISDELDPESPITHGICDRCAEYVRSHRMSIEEFLNTIETPVLAMDEEGRVISANRQALLTLNKKHSQVVDKLGGEVIECEHSSLPGGCRKTIHCTGCQIRDSVDFTRATGEATLHVKAHQHIMTPVGIRTYDYLISTEKLGESTVLLRIDEVKPA